MPPRASESRVAIRMWPAIDTTKPRKTVSWTKVAPVRHERGTSKNYRMIEPMPTMRTMAPSTKAAFNF